jgi:hypothetical protein
MSDNYQAVYDAVTNKITRCDPNGIVERAAREAFFQLADVRPHLQQEIYAVSHEMQRPSVTYRPQLLPDGNMWCALYGEDLATGVVGFGETPAKAMAAFDEAWNSEKPPKLKAPDPTWDGSQYTGKDA